jgi:hypothetical protein
VDALCGDLLPDLTLLVTVLLLPRVERPAVNAKGTVKAVGQSDGGVGNDARIELENPEGGSFRLALATREERLGSEGGDCGHRRVVVATKGWGCGNCLGDGCSVGTDGGSPVTKNQLLE